MAFRRRTKSYPLFSQEFVIHNHADIGFCLVLCVLIGLMFEVTAKTAFLFILPQYNVSMPTADGETVHYRYGPKDLVTVLFYIFIAVILHAVVQEYILDKISKRLHLSKVKHSKFNESGQLVVFHLSSVIWCFYVVVTPVHQQAPCLHQNVEGLSPAFCLHLCPQAGGSLQGTLDNMLLASHESRPAMS